MVGQGIDFEEDKETRHGLAQALGNIEVRPSVCWVEEQGIVEEKREEVAMLTTA